MKLDEATAKKLIEERAIKTAQTNLFSDFGLYVTILLLKEWLIQQEEPSSLLNHVMESWEARVRENAEMDYEEVSSRSDLGSMASELDKFRKQYEEALQEVSQTLRESLEKEIHNGNKKKSESDSGEVCT